MNISYFPKTFVESFSLSDLRIVCKRIEDYCYSNESTSRLPFLKWEQTLGIQKFNKRVLRDAGDSSDKMEVVDIKSLNFLDFRRNKVCLIDFDLLRNDSISSLLLKNIGVIDSREVSILPSKCYLLIARKSKLRKFIQKIQKDHFYLSWVGFDPNLRIQTGMNDYVELEKVFNTYFAVFKT